MNKLRVAKSALMFDGGCAVVVGQPDKRVAFADLAARIKSKGTSLSWQGFFDPETVPLDPQTGQGVPYATYAFAAQLALVTVDVLTGEVSVEKIVAAHDVGKALHPENVIGQICGGVAMGLGFALMEEFEPGKTLSMKDYHIPTCADMPEVVPIIVESPEPSGPFGAKGVGEPALIPTAPAILNAIADALGARTIRPAGQPGAGAGGQHRRRPLQDDFVGRPISALRFAPRELRRTEVRLVPQDLRALILAFLRSHPPNSHQASRATATVSFRSLFLR